MTKLNTHLDLCGAQRITCHIELTGGRIRWASPAITQKLEEQIVWDGPEEEGNGGTD